MQKFKISPVLLVASFIFILMGSATAQELPEKRELPKRVIFFSTEEDFVTRGPVPSGGPIISDGDLLNSAGYVYARNLELLREFPGVKADLGLDAADVIDVKDRFVAFSTELDHPKGLFTAGDLLATNGAILPNSALLVAFDIPRELDLGLDAVHFMGERRAIIGFLEAVRKEGRKFWLDRPESLMEYLKRFRINIWFSTEGTAPPREKPRFLDGDLLSALDGSVVGPNASLLPPSVPAGIPKRGVDFGLDAYTAPTRDYETGRERGLFSTEVLFEGKPSFTDGDVLWFGNGIAITNGVLVRPFEPMAQFLGLDALSVPVAEPLPPCAAVIMQVGGMAAGSINPNGLASGWSATTPSFEAFDSPLGGWVEILGRMPPSKGCEKFKVEYGKWPDPGTPPTTFYALTDPFKEWVELWPWQIWVDRVPDPDGWLDILRNTVKGGLYFPSNTTGKNGKYSLRLTLKDKGGIQYVSSPVVVMIDNTRPKAVLIIDRVPTCGDIFIGEVVTGKITGTDPHFYSYRLRYESSLASGLILPVRRYIGVGDTGDTNAPFKWNTTRLPPCGYRIILEVWDRTIVNNHRGWGEPGYGWRTLKHVYFCLEKKPK